MIRVRCKLTDEQLSRADHAVLADEAEGMAEELLRFRSALAADRERVREVVENVVHKEFTGKYDNDDIVNEDWMEIQRRIATRVADQLAAARPVLSADVRTELDDLLRYLTGQETEAANDGLSGTAAAFGAWRAALSKLLGAT